MISTEVLRDGRDLLWRLIGVPIAQSLTRSKVCLFERYFRYIAWVELIFFNGFCLNFSRSLKIMSLSFSNS